PHRPRLSLAGEGERDPFAVAQHGLRKRPACGQGGRDIRCGRTGFRARGGFGVTIEIVLYAIVLGYLLGSIPFGLLLTRAAGLGDVRTIGSGNIGATNVLRTGNRPLAAATLILDAAK